MRNPWARLAVSERLLVNLRSGKAVGGILVGQSDRVLSLRDASLYELGRDPIPLDGEVLVELDNVDFAQRLAPRTG